jgi:hypothetical protein
MLLRFFNAISFLAYKKKKGFPYQFVVWNLLSLSLSLSQLNETSLLESP